MKALSLWQPWSTAMARGHKTIETRSWATPYRGLVAIHAAKETSDIEKAQGMLEEAWLGTDALPPWDNPAAWPLGCVVAVGLLVDCVLTVSIKGTLSKRELAFGDYSAGRWAWVFEDLRPVFPVVPCKGMQALFTLPAAALATIAAQHPGWDLGAIGSNVPDAVPQAKPKKPPKPDKDAGQLKLF